MTTITPTEMTILPSPGLVEYRQQNGNGVRVVRVLCHVSEPRILAWSERPSANGIEVCPMGLSMSEIELFVQHARQVLEM